MTNQHRETKDLYQQSQKVVEDVIKQNKRQLEDAEIQLEAAQTASDQSAYEAENNRLLLVQEKEGSRAVHKELDVLRGKAIYEASASSHKDALPAPQGPAKRLGEYTNASSSNNASSFKSFEM